MCEVLLEGAAGDARAPGDVPPEDTSLEARAELLVIDIKAPGTPPRRQPSTSA
jgi:hypothetical protein